MGRQRFRRGSASAYVAGTENFRGRACCLARVYASTSVQMRGGKIDLDRFNEPGQRELLARAVFTVDRDAAGSVARDSAARGGGVDLDASLRFVRASLADAADRRRRVAEQEKRFGLV